MTPQRDLQGLEGTCFCGAVRFLVKPPVLMTAYCHCSLCQRLTSCPFIHTVHFPEAQFKWCNNDTDNEGGEHRTFSDVVPIEKLDTFSFAEKPHKIRFRCKNCGVSVTAHNSLTKKYAVWGALFSRYGESDIVVEMGIRTPDSNLNSSESEAVSDTTIPAVGGRLRRDVWDIIKPTSHIFYGTRMLDINDGLEKWEGYPEKSKRL